MGRMVKIEEEYFNTRPNLDVERNELHVFFLAAPGAGKSFLCSSIVKELCATYVSNDEVRSLIEQDSNEVFAAPQVPKIIKATTVMMRSSKNKFIIYDNNIAHYYAKKDSYLNIALRAKIPIFIIAINRSPDDLKHLIQLRPRDDQQRMLGEIDSQLEVVEKAAKVLKPDILIETNDDFDRCVDMLRVIQGK